MAKCCNDNLSKIFCNTYNKYYNTLYINGEISKKETENLLVISYLRKLFINPRYIDYRPILIKALRCIADRSCLLDSSELYGRLDIKTVDDKFVTVQMRDIYSVKIEETDPTVPLYVKDIKQSDIANWDNKLSLETDPVFSASPAATITEEDIDNWNNPSGGGELSDWNETDTSSLAYIKNKPTIPTVPTNVSAFTNDAGYLTLVKTINGSSLVGSGNINTITTFNGVCANRGNIKTSIIDNYSLRDGNIIIIYFLDNDVITGSTLNISNTGAKSILYNGPNHIVTGIIRSNDTAIFVYSEDDNAYILVAVDKWQSRKQDTLVSGTNIKSINNTSLLDSGNINLVPTETFNNFCPIIEDTRSSRVSTITGVAPFASLKDKQMILLHAAMGSWASANIKLTLSNGIDTDTIPFYCQRAGQISRVGSGTFSTEQYILCIYDNTNTRWLAYSIDSNTEYSATNSAEIQAGTGTGNRVVTPKLFHDNAYIVDVPYTSSITALKANKFYDFGTVSSLTIPSLDATNDLVSNALNFYALRFIAGADNLNITFPTGVIVDDEPTINTGDYVEIMINKYGNNFYASIKVWQAQ